jgi:FkbM family methyltransferase
MNGQGCSIFRLRFQWERAKIKMIASEAAMRRSLSDITRSWVRKMRPEARNDLNSLMRLGINNPRYRKLINNWYSGLSFGEKQDWHTHYAKIFRGKKSDCPAGIWRVNFLDREIVLPLGGVDMWLKWDAALSILGHEIEIKRTYASLLRSNFRPKVVFDIGANYGLHSLLFLVHGIKVATFEPNVECHDYFRAIAELNNVSYDLHPVALGENEATVELSFPDTETWLGTTVPLVKQSFHVSEPVSSLQVRQVTLDQFVEEKQLLPDLIKIDTEGAELNVLRGARNTFRQCRPLVIFESWPDNGRNELFNFLTELDYQILRLKKHEDVSAADEVTSFCAAPEHNFLSVPSERSVSLTVELHTAGFN